MNSKEANAIIDDLYEKNQNDYYIDFVPITFPNLAPRLDFADLADYLEVHYKLDFAKKIIFIAFTIIHYYESYVSIIVYDDSDDEEYRETEDYAYYSKFYYKDLRHLELEELATLISKMVIENHRGINILFKNDGKISLMAIEDEYDTYFRNLSSNAFTLVDQLVNQQGIYLKKAPNNKTI